MERTEAGEFSVLNSSVRSVCGRGSWQHIHKLPLIWLCAFVLLSTAPELRIGDVQVLEILQVARVLVVVLLSAYTGFRLPAAGIWRDYGRGYLWLLACLVVLSIAALRLPFYPPSEISLVKEPLVLSISRILELSMAIYFMLAIASMLRGRPGLFRKLLNLYVLVGIVGALASIAAFCLFRVTGQYTFLINDLDHRARGLFNEGGPYGLFLISVVLVLFLRLRMHPKPRRVSTYLALLVLIVAFILSFSKAGVLAGIACLACAGIAFNRRKRLLAVLAVLLASGGFFALFQSGLAGYVNTFLDFDETVLFRPTDRNLVMGRITALFIIPRMIAAHPVTGIGIGNYSLMRNDPQYLEDLPSVDDWDLPGLGLISEAAEFGIPLALMLMILMLRPLWRSRKKKAPGIVLAIAAFQPLALLCGVNLNFFYPWLISAFAIAWLESTDGAGRLFHHSPNLGCNPVPAEELRP